MSTAKKGTCAAASFALLAICAGLGACSGAKASSTPDASSVTDGARERPAGALTVKQPDGTPVPAAFGYGTPIAVEVFDAVTNEPATDATWAAAGACSLDEASGASPVVQPIGLGDCSLTAAVDGMKATVTFKIVVVSSVSIAGDMSAFVIGETRTFTATVVGGAPDVAGVVVQWTNETMAGQPSPAFDVQLAGNSVTVKAIAVGDLSLSAQAGQGHAQLSCNAVPSSIQITASSTNVRAGAAMSVSAKTFGPGGVPCSVAGDVEMQVVDTECLGEIGGGTIEADGSVTFMLRAGEGDCPSVTVVDGAIVSNAISFTVDKVASVVIQGPADPVIVGTMVTLRAVPLDAAGVPFDDGLFAGWVDGSGIYRFTTTGTLEGDAMITDSGTASVVATVNGVQSLPFVSQAVDP